MDNPKTLATLGTQDTGRRPTKQKTKERKTKMLSYTNRQDYSSSKIRTGDNSHDQHYRLPIPPTVWDTLLERGIYINSFKWMKYFWTSIYNLESVWSILCNPERTIEPHTSNSNHIWLVHINIAVVLST